MIFGVPNPAAKKSRSSVQLSELKTLKMAIEIHRGAYFHETAGRRLMRWQRPAIVSPCHMQIKPWLDALTAGADDSVGLPDCSCEGLMSGDNGTDLKVRRQPEVGRDIRLAVSSHRVREFSRAAIDVV